MKLQCKNALLYDKVLQLVKLSLNILEDDLNHFIQLRDQKLTIDKNDPVRKILGNTEKEIIEDELFVFRYVKLIAAINEKTLQKSREYKTCVNLIKMDGTINEQLKNEQISVLGVINRLTPQSFLNHMLVMIISNYIISKKINIHYLNKIYCDFEKFFDEKNITIVTVSALKGLAHYDLSLNSIKISHNISIRKLSLDEKVDIYKRDIPPEIIPINTKWILEYTTSLEKDLFVNPQIEEGFEHRLLDSTLASVITAMRLFQKGSIGIDSYTRYIPLNIPLYTPYMSGLEIMGLDTNIGPYYEFDNNKTTEFTKFWEKFGHQLIGILDFKLPYNNIKNALHRFNYAYQRMTGEDAIVDYVIALEGLMSKGGDASSIMCRVASRSARLLEDDVLRQSSRKKEVKNMYVVRSAIVHGGRKMDGYNLLDAHDLVAKVIEKYLTLSKSYSHDKIMYHLDHS